MLVLTMSDNVTTHVYVDKLTVSFKNNQLETVFS